jgi:CYTH domain-containing protein
MNIEIERKFLINKIPENCEKSIHIKQYYMHIDDNFVQRLRFFDNKKAIISLKQNCAGLSRYEFEYEIPLLDAKKIVSMSNSKFIEKIRHIIYFNSIKWEIDEFLGNNKGLLIAEVELESENQDIMLPNWINSEVTNKNKYFNYNLALKPYISW